MESLHCKKTPGFTAIEKLIARTSGIVVIAIGFLIASLEIIVIYLLLLCGINKSSSASCAFISV
jgi:hypothetical protein